MPSTATRSPGLTRRTALPTSATTALISCPGHTCGSGMPPWYQCRSEPQMPQRRICSRTSSGAGSGTAISSTTTRPGSRANAARMFFGMPLCPTRRTASQCPRIRRDASARLLETTKGDPHGSPSSFRTSRTLDAGSGARGALRGPAPGGRLPGGRLPGALLGGRLRLRGTALGRRLGDARAADLVAAPDLRNVPEAHRDLVLLVMLLAAPALVRRAAAQDAQAHRTMLALPTSLTADLRLVFLHRSTRFLRDPLLWTSLAGSPPHRAFRRVPGRARSSGRPVRRAPCAASFVLPSTSVPGDPGSRGETSRHQASKYRIQLCESSNGMGSESLTRGA